MLLRLVNRPLDPVLDHLSRLVKLDREEPLPGRLGVVRDAGVPLDEVAKRASVELGCLSPGDGSGA
jgi:hypothetical protein